MLFRSYSKTDLDLCVPDKRVTDAFEAYFEILTGEKYPHDRLRTKVFGEGLIYDDGYIKVTAIPTKHCPPMPSYAFVVEGDGKKIVFSGDLSQFFRGNDFPKIVLEEEIDLFVCEMAHFGEEHIAPYLEKCRAHRVMFNHYQPEKEAHIESLAAPGRFPFPISMAHDGESIEI